MNIWDFAMEEGGNWDFKSIFSVKSLSREELRDSLLLTLAYSTARACPRFLAMCRHLPSINRGFYCTSKS